MTFSEVHFWNMLTPEGACTTSDTSAWFVSGQVQFVLLLTQLFWGFVLICYWVLLCKYGLSYIYTLYRSYFLRLKMLQMCCPVSSISYDNVSNYLVFYHSLSRNWLNSLLRFCPTPFYLFFFVIALLLYRTWLSHLTLCLNISKHR